MTQTQTAQEKENEAIAKAQAAVKEITAIHAAAKAANPRSAVPNLPVKALQAQISALSSAKSELDSLLDTAHTAGNMPEVLRIMKLASFIGGEIKAQNANIAIQQGTHKGTRTF